MRTVRIYRLVDPETFAIRYVGQTVKKLSHRLCCHLGSKRKSHTKSWIEALRQKGLKPLIELVCEVQTAEEADELEKILIRFYRSVGCDLTNHDDGGQVRRSISATTRKKQSEVKQGERNARYGKRHDPTTKAAISLTMTGKPKTEAHKVAVSTALTGKPGHPQAPETRDRLRQSHSPNSHSPEQRAAQSAAKKGKPWSAARREAFERAKMKVG